MEFFNKDDLNNNNYNLSYIKNNKLDNTKVLLEDKNSILSEQNNLFDNNNNNNNLIDIYNDNIFNNNKNIIINENLINNNISNSNNNNNNNNSINEIFNNNNNNTEIKKDEDEIEKRQSLFLNQKSSNLDILSCLSKTEINNNNNNILNENSYSKDKIYYNNNNENNNISINFNENYNNKILDFNVVFPTEKIIKEINIKNLNNKQIEIYYKFSEKENIENLKNEKNYFKLFENNKIILNENENIQIKIEFYCEKIIEKIYYCLLEIYFDEKIEKNIILKAEINLPKICFLKNVNFNNNFCFLYPKIYLNFNIKNNIIKKFKIPIKNYSKKDCEFYVEFYKKNFNKNIIFIGNDNKKYNVDFLFDENNFYVPSYGINLFVINVFFTEINNYNNNENFVVNNDKILKNVIILKILNSNIKYFIFLEIKISNDNKLS
jgi:hypothetical protein